MKTFRILLPLWLVSVVNSTILRVGPRRTYSNITSAYNAAAPGDTIYVYPGIYREKLVITKNNLTLKGSAYPSLNPADNDALIVYATYASAVGSNDASATVLVNATNFKMYNMNVTNSAGRISQAVALSATGINQGFYASAFHGWQDTLYSHFGTQFFGGCYIEGAIDFIFGVTGQSWYQGCKIGVLRSGAWITAQGRTSTTVAGYFVFDKAKIVLGAGAPKNVTGAVYLGRPWRDFARVVFQYSNLNNMIAPVGWQAWNSTQNTSQILFGEYANSNSAGKRIPWATKLTGPIRISTILPNYKSWVDRDYLNLRAR